MAIQEQRRETDPDFGVKCFSFIPEPKISRKFITVDTKTLRTILSQLIGRGEIKAVHHQRNWTSPRTRAGYQLESSNSRKGSNRKNIPTSQRFGDDRVENCVWHAPSEEVVQYKKKDFISSVDICHVLPGSVFRRWERSSHDRADQTSYLPRSITTDGIQVHVGFQRFFTRRVKWPTSWDPTRPVPCNKVDSLVRKELWTEVDHGLFNANEIKMADIEAVASEPGAEQPRIVAVDPGVTNVFTSVAMDLDEFKRLSGQV